MMLIGRSLLTVVLLTAALGACAPVEEGNRGGSGGGIAGTGFAGAVGAGMGVAGTGAAGTGFAGAGVASAAAAGTGVAGMGLGGTGVSGTGVAGTGFGGTGASGTGVAGTGFGGTGASGTGVAGTGVAGTGASGTGVAGTGVGGTGASGTGASGTGGGGPSQGTMTVSFTTVTTNGEYAPLNYGAVWIETGTGQFIKTVKRWAGITHASDLVAWTAASGGWGSLFFPANPQDQVDVVSQATIRSHQAHTVTWNMTDNTPALVPDGGYICAIEMSEDRAFTPGPVVRIPFTKSAAGAMETAADQRGFTGITLNYQP